MHIVQEQCAVADDKITEILNLCETDTDTSKKEKPVEANISDSYKKQEVAEKTITEKSMQYV